MKYIYGVAVLILLAIALGWTFNHFDPWIAILATVVMLGILIPIFKQLNKKPNK